MLPPLPAAAWCPPGWPLPRRRPPAQERRRSWKGRVPGTIVEAGAGFFTTTGPDGGSPLIATAGADVTVPTSAPTEVGMPSTRTPPAGPAVC